jgi:hypothetical protein
MRAPAVALLALLVATPASSQNWTAEEQSVIDHVLACWDAWVEAVADETPDRWAAACPFDENAYWWFTAEGVPNNLGLVYRNWDLIRERSDDWIDLRPIRVNVFGDVAIIHFYAYWNAENTRRGGDKRAKADRNLSAAQWPVGLHRCAGDASQCG